MPDTYQSPLGTGGFLGGFQQGQANVRQQAIDDANAQLAEDQKAFQKQSADLLQQKYADGQVQQGKENDRADKELDLKEKGLANTDAYHQGQLQAQQAKLDAQAKRQQLGIQAKAMFDQGKGMRDVFKFMLGNGAGQPDAIEDTLHAFAAFNTDRVLHNQAPLPMPDIVSMMHEESPTGQAIFHDPNAQTEGANVPTGQFPAGQLPNLLNLPTTPPASGVASAAPDLQGGVAPAFQLPQFQPQQAAPPVAGAPTLPVAGAGLPTPGGTAAIGTPLDPTAPIPGVETLEPIANIGKAAGNGVLPLIQGKMDVQKSVVAKNQQAVKTQQAKVENDRQLLDPKIREINSRITNREAMEQEKERHNHMTESLAQTTQQMNLRLKQAQIDLTKARTGNAQQSNPALGRVRTALMQDLRMANSKIKDATTERDKMIAEATRLNAVMQQPPPDRNSFKDRNGVIQEGLYQKALQGYETTQTYGKNRLEILAGPDGKAGRIAELDGQIENLNAVSEHHRNALGSGVTINGKPVNLSGPNLSPAANVPNPGNMPYSGPPRTNLTSVSQVGATPNVSFSGNAQGDRDRVNPNLLSYMQQKASGLGYQVQVGTAISGHNHNVSGTNRTSQHMDGSAFDITQIKGPDGVWHSANVNDPTGYQMALQLGHSIAQDGHQAIFGTVLREGGNHLNHLHVGFHPNGGGTSYLPGLNSTPQDAIRAAKGVTTQNTQNNTRANSPAGSPRPADVAPQQASPSRQAPVRPAQTPTPAANGLGGLLGAPQTFNPSNPLGLPAGGTPARTSAPAARPASTPKPATSGKTDYSKMSDSQLKQALARKLMGNH